MQNLKYNNIIYNDNANGDGGMRVSFFCQGCHFHCKGCFNPHTHDFNGGKEFNNETLDEMIFVINMYRDYYKGLNLLGGECFDNLDIVLLVVKTFKVKFPEKNIWIWSGYTFNEIIKDKNKLELLSLCDVLIDGQFVEELKRLNLKYKGSSNQRVINVQESLKQNKVILLED